MASKELNQTGLNRAMFVMLRRLLQSEQKDRIVIPEHEIENGNIDDAIQIQCDSNSKVFVFSLHKAKNNKNISKIIIPEQG